MEGQTLESIPPGSSTKHASEFRGAVIPGFLENYESVKLSVADPEVHQAIILLVFGLLVCFASRKTNRTPLLDRQQTEQLKGFAIFLVILGHLWVHVSDSRPLLVLSGDGVTIFFFMLSGFGLAVSSGNRRPNARTFAVRRLMRVMLPYWLATAFIVALDAILLGRLLSPVDLTLTLLGVNIGDATRHLDYARWFVTSILLWYVLFYLVMLLKDKAGLDPLFCLFSCGLALYLFNHYVYSFASQEFAFPAGCALARYRDEMRNRFERSRRRWGLGAVILLAGGILYKALIPLVYPQLWPMLFFRFSF
jgi:peptidoglycan/LPS O-acetylase OafA/YrhL